MLPDVMLAYEMDGGPISRPHGAPVRLVMPEMYGYKSVKWVDHIELGTDPAARLLGAARLRRGRLDRQLEWLLGLSTRLARRADPALHPHRAGAPLGARIGVLRPARDRADPLPPCALDADQPPQSRQERPHLGCRRLAVAIVVIIVAGNRRRLAADWREIETIDRDDRRWLRGRTAPQGRFNAGQKLNALLTVAFALLFALSGFFLWLGERDHRFLFAGTGTVHDALTLFSVLLLVGHLYLALIHPAPACAAGDDDGRRRRGLGARAPREVGRGRAPLHSLR